MTAAELLQSLNLLDEQERVEAKRASEVGQSLLETVCAFANEPQLGGGWLLLGAVREEMALFPAYEIEGVSNPDKLSADIASQCRDVFNVPVRVDISTETIQGKTVLVVFVPEAQPHEKPIFFKKTGLPRGAFRRIGSTDQKCTDDDLAVLYQGRQIESFDASLVPDSSLADLSAEAIADYRKSRKEAYPDAEELRWSDEELLEALGAVRRDDKRELRPTVAGIILFGKATALRRLFPMTRVDYIRVAGRDWVADPDERFDTIELRDPLFRLIRRAQAAVVDDLPKGFGLSEGELQRQDKPVIPLKVIREAIVNALMHRNYRSHSPVQIIRYANRLEIRNPGFSLKSPEHLGDPGSQPRNPKIAAVLHETRFAETKGSGIRVMRESMEQAGLTPPLFESDRGNDQFVARYFFHHFLGEEDIAWLSQFKDLQLSSEEAKALIVVREAGAIDNSTYRELNKVDVLTASGALRRLRDAGLLTQKGRGSATYYVPTDRLTGKAPLSGNPSGLSGNPPALSGNLSKAGMATNMADADLGEAPNLEPDQGSGQRRALLSQLPGDLAATVGALGKRNSPDQVKRVIVELCTQRPWSAEELSTLVSRNVKHLRETYLGPLVREGRIKMTNPSEPNDPTQAYKADLS